MCIRDRIIVVGAEKMSSIINYTDRATCPIFVDGGAAVMLEATTEDLGKMCIRDSIDTYDIAFSKGACL